MTPALKIITLGGLKIHLGDQPIPPLVSRKAEALLIYLAATGRAHPRQSLAHLLWDNQPTNRALSNLSVLLSSIRKHIDNLIIADRQTISLNLEFNITLDSFLFEQKITAARDAIQHNGETSSASAGLLENALALYHGEFLHSFQLRRSRGFEEWAVLERERLQLRAFEAHQNLITYYLHRGAYADGLRHARHLLRLDPFREETHRQLIILLVRNGQRHEAIEQYRICEQILDTELGVPPSPTTRALFERIQNAHPVPAHIPKDLTAFVGRTNELAQITQRLANPQCRLLTLLGPGGIGKSRLAIEIANRHKQAYIDGVHFVSLESVQNAEMIIPALAETWGITFVKKDIPQEQILHYLADKEMLLILDNYEHLVRDTQLIENILTHAPDLTLLITSRERLNLHGEWLLEISGLSTPNGDAAPQQNSEAVQFFLSCATRIDADFSIDEKNLIPVTQICQLVGGTPLGIELAAAWVRILSPKEIASEIKSNLDFLESPSRNAPERHRSIRAVFDYSWARLSVREQASFTRLSVFRGGFSREAAQKIAGASLRTLTRLVDQSLLYRDDQRYKIHALLRQFASEKFDSPASKAAIEQTHSRYFGDFMATREPILEGPQQMDALRDISREIDNIRSGWQSAALEKDFATLAQSIHIFFLFYFSKSWILEGSRVFADAIQKLGSEIDNHPQLHTKLLSRCAKFHELLGDTEKAHALNMQSLKIAEADNNPPDIAYAYFGLGYTYLVQSSYKEAKDVLGKGLRIYETLNNPIGVSSLTNVLCQVMRRMGDYKAAQAYGERALALRRKIGNPRAISSTLNNLAMVHLASDDYAQAKTLLEEGLEVGQAADFVLGNANILGNLAHAVYFLGEKEQSLAYTQESLKIYQQIGDRWGVAIAYNNLGYSTANMGKYQAAKAWYSKSLRYYRELGNGWGISSILGSLGYTCLHLAEFEEAETHLSEALPIAIEIDAPRLIVDAVINWGHLFIETGNPRGGASLLAYALDHPAIHHPEDERARGVLETARAALSPATYQAAQTQARQWAQAKSGLNDVVQFIKSNSKNESHQVN